MPSGLLQPVHQGDEVAQGNEGARRQDEEQHAAVFGVDGEAENLARAQQLAHGTQQGQSHGETQAHAQAVEHGGYRPVLGCEGLGTPQEDTVHHDKRDEQAQRGIQCRHVGLHNHLEQCDKRGYHHHEGRDAHHVGDEVLYGRDDHIGAHQHEGGGQSHAHAVDGGRGCSKRGAHAQEQYKGRVLLDNAIH